MPVDMFLKIDTIDGESKDTKHKDWIEILSYNHGVHQPATGSAPGGGGDRVVHEDFSIGKVLDKASPKLALACCEGQDLREVRLVLRYANPGGQEYFEYKLTDAKVTSVSPSGAAQGDEPLPAEEVSFNYAKIEWTYTSTAGEVVSAFHKLNPGGGPR